MTVIPAPRGENATLGRPAIGPRVHFNLQPHLVDKIDEIARRTHSSRAGALRFVISVGLAACAELDLGLDE